MAFCNCASASASCFELFADESLGCCAPEGGFWENAGELNASEIARTEMNGIKRILYSAILARKNIESVSNRDSRGLVERNVSGRSLDFHTRFAVSYASA